MNRNQLFVGATVVVAVLLVLVAGCDLAGFTDVIEGSWQQVSVDGVSAVLATVVTFTHTTYSVAVAGVVTNEGAWTRSEDVYTLNGTFIGFLSTTTSLTPTFTNSNDTLTFTDDEGRVQIYSRQ
jgi:hypothetical protein